MKQLSSHDFKKVYEWLGINLNTLGCVMLDIEPLSNMYTIEFEGAGVALYYAKNKERFWIDGWVIGKIAHITLLYGLLEKGKNYVPHIEEVLKGWELSEVEIDHIGYFDSPYEDELYWCLVAHIKLSPELLEGHRRLEFLPHVNTFSDYKAHITICYLNKEQGEQYRDDMIREFNELWAGKRLKVKSALNLGGDR
jgi:2'-5' RNA ligase